MCPPTVITTLIPTKAVPLRPVPPPYLLPSGLHGHRVIWHIPQTRPISPVNPAHSLLPFPGSQHIPVHRKQFALSSLVMPSSCPSSSPSPASIAPSVFRATFPVLVLLLLVLLPSKCSSAKQACDAAEFADLPCRCCKMDCWYSIAGAATHQLGHVPGQAGEEEALATLRLIRACMIAECSTVCVAQRQMAKKKRWAQKLV